MTNHSSPSVERQALVVDDDRALARVLRILLMTEGFNVRVAANGREALDSVSASVPDVVLLDLQMPVMDGRTFFREFRLQGYQSPVVILSAYNAEGARQEMGAEAAVNKPFDPDAVRLIVQNLLSQSSKG